MLTSLYSIFAILKSLLFGDSGSLSDWYRQRSLLLGILGRLAQVKRIPLSAPEVAKVFGVKPKTVYKNIKRNEALAAKIQEMLKALAGCIIVPRRNVTVSISDAGSGLLKGIKAAFPKADIQIDVFHVFRDFGRAVSHFKKHVLKKVMDCYDLEKAVSKGKSWHAGYKEKKKQLKESQAKIPALVDDYDTLTIRYSWTHELLSFSGYNPDEVKELMRWLLEEMNALASRNSWAFELRRELSRFEERLPATMRFLDRLFAAFDRAARDVGLPEEAFRLLYRRSAVPKDSETYLELTRQALAVTGPERFGAVEKTHDRILGSIKRASSMVENVNNRLRPYMDIKKHVSSQFYSLIQLYLNTKKYRRSRIESRVGRSPVEILTSKQWPELIELLEERGFWAEQTAEEVA